MMDFSKALSKAAALCSRQERCVSEIRKKLQDWEVNIEDQEKIIDRLVSESFIDEERFAAYFVRDKFRFNRWGKIKISFHLKQKGVANGTVFEALKQIQDIEYADVLRDILHSKFKSIKESDLYKVKASLFRFAAGRGFEAEIIYPILEELLLES